MADLANITVHTWSLVKLILHGKTVIALAAGYNKVFFSASSFTFFLDVPAYG